MSQTQVSAPIANPPGGQQDAVQQDEVIPRLKTREEALQDEGFLPEGIEVHHSEEEVVDRLFSLGMPEEVKSVWGWAQNSLAGSSLSSLAEKAIKSAEEVAENVKASAEELAENVKTTAEGVVQSAQEKVGEMQEAGGSVETKFVYPWEPRTRFSTEIRERVLRLPEENNTFLVPPPEEVKFTFDFDHNADAAIRMLEADPKLEKKRFELVPRQLDENTFWRNYFYRVELIKRSYGAEEELAQKEKEMQKQNVAEIGPSSESQEQETYKGDEVDAKLLDDDDSLEFDNTNLTFESKKGQKESKRGESNTGELSWEDELQAEVDSENFDMLNDDELLDEDGDADDSDLEERIKAQLSLS